MIAFSAASGNGSFTSNDVQMNHVTAPDWEDSWSMNTFNTFNNASPVYTSQGSVTIVETDEENWVEWTLPGSFVQGWIDDSASNYGLFFKSTTTAQHQDVQFSSLEGSFAAELIFNAAVPEPSLLALCILGALAASLGRCQPRRS
jgi:hypothetical protein